MAYETQYNCLKNAFKELDISISKITHANPINKFNEEDLLVRHARLYHDVYLQSNAETEGSD